MEKTVRRMERRRHPRADAENDLFVVLPNRPVKMGAVEDLSPQGLSFYYVDGEKPFIGSFTVDLFTGKTESYFCNLPVKAVFDIRVDVPGRFRYIPVRRCGVRFDEMTDSYRVEFERFLSGIGSGRLEERFSRT